MFGEISSLYIYVYLFWDISCKYVFILNGSFVYRVVLYCCIYNEIMKIFKMIVENFVNGC